MTLASEEGIGPSLDRKWGRRREGDEWQPLVMTPCTKEVPCVNLVLALRQMKLPRELKKNSFQIFSLIANIE